MKSNGIINILDCKRKIYYIWINISTTWSFVFGIWNKCNPRNPIFMVNSLLLPPPNPNDLAIWKHIWPCLYGPKLSLALQCQLHLVNESLCHCIYHERKRWKSRILWNGFCSWWYTLMPWWWCMLWAIRIM